MSAASRNVGAGLLCLAILRAAGAPSAGAPAADVPPDPASIRQGRALFVEHCAVCHGYAARGEGVVGDALTKAPANLQALARHHDADWFLERITSGRGQMHPFAHSLHDAQRRSIANYLARLGAPTIP